MDSIVLLILFFVSGKFVSWWVYQSCWNTRVHQQRTRGVGIESLKDPVTVFLVLLNVLILYPLSWEQLPHLFPVACTSIWVLSISAVLRLGAVDLDSFFLLDRLMILVLAILVTFYPVTLLPWMLYTCRFQYVVSSWSLSPGYSNLLGFEFLRMTASSIFACCFFARIIPAVQATSYFAFASNAANNWEPISFSAVLSLQASTYVNHALAKCWLGKKWYSWICHNRIECLFVNSYLRGWWMGWLSSSQVLRIARQIGRMRIYCCAGAIGLEFGFLFLLLDQKVACLVWSVAIAFHVTVFLMTGLLAYHYVINHLVLIGTVMVSWPIGNGPLTRLPDLQTAFGNTLWIGSALCIAAAWVWVGSIRWRIYQEYIASGRSVRWAKFSDAADLLMAWWDSPAMRMYSYQVRTVTGETCAVPVCRLAPYDTILTDIHTHAMLLNMHTEFDTKLAIDRQILRTGVWGMVRTEEEREKLYALQDTPGQLASTWLGPWFAHTPQNHWCVTEGTKHPACIEGLWRLFDGIRRNINNPLYRLGMHWPHFPGEDLVPDIPPIVSEPLPIYTFDKPFDRVEIVCHKTFYDGTRLLLLDTVLVGTLQWSTTSKA
jgi:hypothetical protein